MNKIPEFWQVSARSAPIWSEQWVLRLIQLLGHKPRRLSAFSQAVLYGALDCLSCVPEAERKQLSVLRLSTRQGAHTSTLKMIEVSQSDLPMPFVFLQSQLNQALTALLAALKWQGDASLLMTKNDDDFVKMALLSAQSGSSVLLGWADELTEHSLDMQHWLWLTPASDVHDAAFNHKHGIKDEQVRYVMLDDKGIHYAV